jgi:nucleoside-diphosphate-sugar epimerase
MVAEAIGWQGTLQVSDEDPAGSINYSQNLYSESALIRQELGYSERISFKEGIRLTIGNESPE